MCRKCHQKHCNRKDYGHKHCNHKDKHTRCQSEFTTVQFLNLADFEGRLFSQPIDDSGRFGHLSTGINAGLLTECDANRPVGGLATIQTYFKQELKNNKNTLILSGGETYTSSNRNLFRVTNSQQYYKSSSQAFKKLGLNAHGISWHDFSDQNLISLQKQMKRDHCNGIYNVAVGINDPLNQLPYLKKYHIFDMNGVKVAYTTIPDPRTMTNGFVNDPSFSSSRFVWGNITVETDIVTLVQLADQAMIEAKAEGAQITVLNIGRGWFSGGTGNTVMSNVTQFDVIYFDNSAQELAGFRADKNGKLVLCLAPWTAGEDYSRFSIVYDNVQDKIKEFRGKNNEIVVQIPTSIQDPETMQKVLVPAFADNVYGDPSMQALINCFDKKSHKCLDVKVAELTRNLILGLFDFIVPDSDNTIYLNLVADSIRAVKNTDISLVARRVVPSDPNRWLVGCKELAPPDAITFGGIAHAKWGPRKTNFRRVLAPYDLLKGDIWDSIYNENGTNFVSYTNSLTINVLFRVLEVVVSFIPGFNDRAIQGISGFTYVFDKTLPGSDKVTEVTIENTGKTYVRQPDGSIPDGNDTVSVTLDNYTLLSGSFSNPTYPLLTNADWVNCEYGTLVNATIRRLESLGIFDPNDPQYSNRWVGTL